MLRIALVLTLIASPAFAQPYDYNAAQRAADELANLRMQQQQQYYEMKERQERQDYDDRMRRIFPDWDR